MKTIEVDIKYSFDRVKDALMALKQIIDCGEDYDVSIDYVEQVFRIYTNNYIIYVKPYTIHIHYSLPQFLSVDERREVVYAVAKLVNKLRAIGVKPKSIEVKITIDLTC